MALENRDIMAAARSNLKGKWGIAIPLGLIFFVIFMVIGLIPFVGLIATLVLRGALNLGLYSSFLGIIQGKEIKVGNLFDGFSCFGSSCIAYLLIILFTILWTLLLIIPGIIASLSYAMTFFILSENHDITGLEAIRRSKQMMEGNKWQLFCLGLRFIGWFLLGIITVGIGFLWIGPYYLASLAKFYDDVREPAVVQPAMASFINPV
jgi:uncharacterized membrane protein